MHLRRHCCKPRFSKEVALKTIKEIVFIDVLRLRNVGLQELRHFFVNFGEQLLFNDFIPQNVLVDCEERRIDIWPRIPPTFAVPSPLGRRKL